MPERTAGSAAAGVLFVNVETAVRGPMRIEIDVYSGRPNPAWAPSGRDVAQLNALIATLSRRTRAPPRGGLGFRGFIITVAGRRLEVAGDRVIEGTEAWADPERGIESFLCKTMPGDLKAAFGGMLPC